MCQQNRPLSPNPYFHYNDLTLVYYLKYVAQYKQDLECNIIFQHHYIPARHTELNLKMFLIKKTSTRHYKNFKVIQSPDR